MQYEMEDIFEILKKNLKVIVNNYPKLIENKKVKNSILKEEQRLESYLLKDLSNSNNLEDDLQRSIKEYKGKINKLDSSKMLKKKNKRKVAKNELMSGLMEGLVELLFGFIIMGLGVFFAWLFSFKKSTANMPFEVYMIVGFVAFIIIAFFIGLIVLIAKDREK